MESENAQQSKYTQKRFAFQVNVLAFKEHQFSPFAFPWLIQGTEEEADDEQVRWLDDGNEREKRVLEERENQ